LSTTTDAVVKAAEGNQGCHTSNNVIQKFQASPGLQGGL